MTGVATTAAAGLVLAPGLAAATPTQPPGPNAVGVDPYTGEPLDAGPNCDRGFQR